MQPPPHRELLLELVAEVPRPVFATISGAHLYGFESPDSDVDLRGAFVAPEATRLGVSAPEETVSLMSDESGVELDWVAHDITKCLRLIARGSGEVMEQVLSPIVLETSPWHPELQDLTQACLTRSLYRHYAGFFHSRRQLLEGPAPTVKVLLYAYRAVLTGVHVLRTGELIAHLPTLLEAYPQAGVPELIQRKRTGAEKGVLDNGEAASHTAALDRLEAALSEAAAQSALPPPITSTTPTYRRINDYLIRIRRHDDEH